MTSSTYLVLTNKVLARLNEVQLTTTTWSSARGIQVQAQNAINEVAKEQKYTYIFDISLGSIVYGEESRDIMPLVKSKLGIE